MGKQTLEVGDYFAPIVCGLIFAVILFVLSIFINFLCISKRDDITAFERWGLTKNRRMGVHRLSVVRRVVTSEEMPETD